VAGTIHQRPCLHGYYQPTAPDSASDGTCPSCAAGEFCSEEGLEATGGTCAAGYICELGSFLERPAIEVDAAQNPAVRDTSDSHSYGLCPRGKYCTAGTTTGTACADGKYQNSLGAIDSTFCLACPRGKYCASAANGLAVPTGDCQAGFYCDSGSTTASGSQCEMGHYCPAGIAVKTKCVAGTYQPSAEKDACLAC
jgi:hypothetical protein